MPKLNRLIVGKRTRIFRSGHDVNYTVRTLPESGGAVARASGRFCASSIGPVLKGPALKISFLLFLFSRYRSWRKEFARAVIDQMQH